MDLFLDSDDIYHNSHLEKFNELIITKKQIGIYFSGISFDKYLNDNQYYNLSVVNNVEFVLLNTFATSRACVSSFNT